MDKETTNLVSTRIGAVILRITTSILQQEIGITQNNKNYKFDILTNKQSENREDKN